jgi:hypothetical protein
VPGPCGRYCYAEGGPNAACINQGMVGAANPNAQPRASAHARSSVCARALGVVCRRQWVWRSRRLVEVMLSDHGAGHGADADTRTALPRLHRDWARPIHVRTGTGLASRHPCV